MTNDARLVRSLRSLEQKPKIFLAFPFPRRGVWGEPTKNGKEIFGFAVAASDYKMSYLYFTTYRSIVSLISPSLRRDKALPSPRFEVA